MPQMPNDETPVIDFYCSSDQGVRFTAGEHQQTHPQLVEDERPFDYCRYAQEIHAPVPLPDIDTGMLAGQWPRCLDMPLRLAGQEQYALPEDWQDLQPLLEQIIAVEHANNPHWQEYHTYMTVDCSPVTAGEQQRHGGLHVDGFQGERINPKTKITRNYVVSTNGGTRFFPQRFIVVDPAQYNVFHGFDMQTQGWYIHNYQEGQENIVHFMDAYTVHESGFASRDGERVFVRLTWDIKPFDRLGNTHNSMLEYQWEMVTRTVHQEVHSPDISQLEESPYYPVVSPAKDAPGELLLIGISGKPGSGKNWISFRLLQELRHVGINAGKTSLAREVYTMANELIPACQRGASVQDLARLTGFTNKDLLQQLQHTWQGDVGKPHPQWGYHRRNQAVREGLALLSQLARDEDEHYWLNKMLADAHARGLQAAVFSDLRFPNEAAYVQQHHGICLRADRDPVWLAATEGRNPGYKYSDASLNSPMESALDDYQGFVAHVSPQTFDAQPIVARILSPRS